MSPPRSAARLRAGALLAALLAAPASGRGGPAPGLRAPRPGGAPAALSPAHGAPAPRALAARQRRARRRGGAGEAAGGGVGQGKPTWLREMEPTSAITQDIRDADPVIAAHYAEQVSDAGWPHAQLSSPLGYSADELLLPPPEEQVRVPPLAPLVGAPGSPPSEEEISPANQWAKVLADTIDPPEVSAAVHARGIVGQTCKEVCLQCHLDMQVNLHKMTCDCFADCLRGVDGESCSQDAPRGWSNSDLRTRPVEEWRAACGGGDRNCTRDCLSAQLLGALHRCDSQEPRAECVLKVREVYERSSPEVLDDGKSYCSRPLIKTCQEFHTIPQGDIDITGAGRWTCFPTREACEREVFESTNPQRFDDVRETPSVWKSVSSKIVPVRAGRFA